MHGAMRDLRVMLAELHGEGGVSNFGSSYLNEQNKEQPEFRLPKREALMMKPIIEGRAKANSVASGERFGKGSQNSDEPIAPIRTDDAVAEMAGVSRDTVRKVEAIKESAAPEVVQAVRSGGLSINLAAQVAELPQGRRVVQYRQRVAYRPRFEFLPAVDDLRPHLDVVATDQDQGFALGEAQFLLHPAAAILVIGGKVR